MTQRIELPSTVTTPWVRNNRIPALIAEPAGRARAGLVLLHGYTMRKEAMEYEARMLSRFGVLVMAPDLPLHGERTVDAGQLFEYPFYGDPQGVVHAFENAVADMRTCALHLRKRLGGDAPIGITGFSLGGCMTILAMARLPGLFRAGVSVVGAARIARLLLTSTICGDIRDDLLAMGYDEARLEPIVRPVEATEYASEIHNLLLIGADDDRIVPGALVRETYDALEHESNELVMFDGCGHFPPPYLVAQHALPFFARYLALQ